MGFSYNYLGLCCDFCSNAGPKGNVRKISCPYGYCQAWACCETCKKAKKHLMSSCGGTTHKESCKKASIEYDMKQYAKTLNELGIHIIIRESMYCSKCKQRIGTIRIEDVVSAYPCLNSKCKNYSSIDLIKSTWAKMNNLEVLA